MRARVGRQHLARIRRAKGTALSSLYYLAASDADALSTLGDPGPSPADGVLAHDMITVPHLTALADLGEGKPVAIDLSATTPLWPPMPDDPETDLSWMAEPVIERVADALRDRLAALDPDRLDAWVASWSAEVAGAVDPDASPRLAAELIALARRGRDRRLALYNRYEL